MKFIIEGTEYPVATIDRVTGALALELTRQTRFGVKTLAQRLEESDRLGYGDDGVVVVLPEGDQRIVGSSLITESEPHFRAMLAFIWLARWVAGEHLSFDEAVDFPLDTLEVVIEADEAGDDEPDPTSPATLGSPPDLPAAEPDGDDAAA